MKLLKMNQTWKIQIILQNCNYIRYFFRVWSDQLSRSRKWIGSFHQERLWYQSGGKDQLISQGLIFTPDNNQLSWKLRRFNDTDTAVRFSSLSPYLLPEGRRWIICSMKKSYMRCAQFQWIWFDYAYTYAIRFSDSAVFNDHHNTAALHLIWFSS